VARRSVEFFFGLRIQSPNEMQRGCGQEHAATAIAQARVPNAKNATSTFVPSRNQTEERNCLRPRVFMSRLAR
jgi:hypothetical protein